MNTINQSYKTITKRMYLYQDNPQLDLFVSYVWQNSLDGEEWRELPQAEGNYFYSNKGRVLSVCKGYPHILKQQKCGGGYLYTTPFYDGKKHNLRTNIIVATLFLDKPKDNSKVYEVHHIDRDRTNNDVSNLIFLTIEEHKEIHRKLNQQENEKNEETLLH